MSDLTVVEVLNRRVAVAAVHAEAARIGTDADALLDSQAFYDSVTQLDPDAPGYRKQVAEMVAAAAGRVPQTTHTATAEPAAPAAPRQWTMQDVEALPSTPAGGRRLNEAIDAGLLRDLGVAPRKMRR